MKPRCTDGRWPRERGAYLILMTFGLIALLAVAAFIMDGAKLYRTRIRMQRAADAGVIGALAYRAHKGPLASDSEMEAAARDITLVNLTQSDFVEDVDSSDIIVTYNPAGVRVGVQFDGVMQFFLLHLIPFDIFGVANGFRGGATLRTRSEGELKVANIALVLDSSGSMACDTTTTADCYSCMEDTSDSDVCSACTSVPATAACASTKKIDKLKVAVDKFTQLFTPGRDRIGVVQFGTGARALRQATVFCSAAAAASGNCGSLTTTDWTTIRSGAGSARPYWEPLLGQIWSIEPSGNTNPSSALMVAYDLMRAAGVAGNEDSFYVFFSDGAPTAGRFLFPPTALNDMHANDARCLSMADGVCGITSTRVGFASQGSADYSSYKVAWDNNKFGPSPLIKTRLLPAGLNAAALTTCFTPCAAAADAAAAAACRETCLSAAAQPSINTALPEDNLFASASPDAEPPLPLDTAAEVNLLPNCNREGATWFTVHSLDPSATDEGQLYSKTFIGSGPLDGGSYCFTGANCLRFHMPEDPDSEYPYPPSSTSSAPCAGWPTSLDEWLEQYYNVTLALGDFVRTTRGRVMAIGLGPDASPNCDQNTPASLYQTVKIDTTRKDCFLGRLAYDRGYQYNFPGFSPLPSDYDSELGGVYSPTDNADDLEEIFEKVARRILMRLIQ